jgi:hypothetical protein
VNGYGPLVTRAMRNGPSIVLSLEEKYRKRRHVLAMA